MPSYLHRCVLPGRLLCASLAHPLGMLGERWPSVITWKVCRGLEASRVMASDELIRVHVRQTCASCGHTLTLQGEIHNLSGDWVSF